MCQISPFTSDPVWLRTDALKDQAGRVKVWYGGQFVELTGTPNSNETDRVLEALDLVRKDYPGADLVKGGGSQYALGDFDGNRVQDFLLHIEFPDSLSRSDSSEVVLVVMGKPWERRTEIVYELYRRHSRQNLSTLKAGSLVDWGLFRRNPFRLKTDAVGHKGGAVYVWYGGTFLPFESSP